MTKPAHLLWICVPLLCLLIASSLSCNPAGLSGGSGTGDTYADRGMRAYVQGNYESAVENLETAVQKGVKRNSLDEVHTVLGNAYNELERFDESIVSHKRALELNPKGFKAWTGLGVTYRLIGDLDESEKCYRLALGIEPSYAEAHASLGALYIFRDEPEKAINSLEHAISLDPQLPIGHANLALAYAMTGRFDEAGARLKQSVVLGYKNGPVIKERIDALREFKE